MSSSTLLYIAWPVTLGLSFMAGGMILSNKPITENSKKGNQSTKTSHINSFSNHSAATNRRSVFTRTRSGKDTYAESYDIKKIANTCDFQKRLTTLLSMLDQLGPGDFEQVVTDFRELGMTDERATEYRLLLKAWAKINPEGALAYAKENTNSTFASDTILYTWARYAPDAAIKWVKLNHKGDKANPYLVGIIKVISGTNPKLATDILQELPSGYNNEYFDVLDAIVPYISKLGTEKVTTWLAAIKDKKLHTTATRWLVRSLARKDPQATADWLRKLPADSQKFSAAIVADEWADQDIDKAAEWTGSLEGKTRIDAAREMMREFVSSDPNKAAAWMKTMSRDPDYAKLVHTFIRTTSSDHPEAALANLDQMSSNRLRNTTKQNILTEWATKDKAAATQWMQNNHTDAVAQQKILSIASKMLEGKGL